AARLRGGNDGGTTNRDGGLCDWPVALARTGGCARRGELRALRGARPAECIVLRPRATGGEGRTGDRLGAGAQPSGEMRDLRALCWPTGRTGRKKQQASTVRLDKGPQGSIET